MFKITVRYNSTIPVCDQIYSGIVDERRSGNLYYKTKMPSTAQVAGVLGLNLSVVDRAYGLLLNDRVIRQFKNKKYVMAPGDTDINPMLKKRSRNK
jgi:DNA-binding transcriptional regulator YhcF (GntR family)